MEQNVGVLDSTLRVLLGFALLFVGFIIAAPLKYVAFAAFLVLVVTGLSGKCPLYGVLHICTWEANKP